MRIILLGYMGSGKTSIGKKLAKETGVQFIDLDAYIVKKEGQEIAQIFKNKGEIYFRKLENECLKTLLEREDDFILSVGGGTPCYANNMLLITENSQTIYLKASVQNLYEKLRLKKSKRPLIKNIANTELKEFIAKHLFERAPYYEQASLIISTDGKKKKEIVKELMLNMQ